MKILPTCSHYLRRVLKRNLKASSLQIPDLLQSSGTFSDLEKRLRFLYSDDHTYSNVILHLEQLTYSHQHAHSHSQETALRDISTEILWWLGYGVDWQPGGIIESSTPSLPSTPTVFIIDDTLETLKLVTAVLTKAGYHVNSALTGNLGLMSVRTCLPDLILLDIKLPDMDGYEVYRQLKKNPKTSNISIIFLSGMDRSLTHLPDVTDVSYLQKPFKPDILLERVKQVIGDAPKTSTSFKDKEVELSQRKHEASVLLSQCLEDTNQLDPSSANDSNLSHFFRATLDGRYLRVGSALARLCGYQSSIDMVSKVTNLWSQIYQQADSQEQWSVCLQYPNQPQVIPAKIKTQSNMVLDVVDKICIVQDPYNNRLFYEGYVRKKE